MDKKLFNILLQTQPKFSNDVVDGFAVRPMRHVESYVDRAFRTAARDFPPDLQYLGYAPCTPQEEYQEATRRLSKNSTYEVSRSDRYMIKLRFAFRGEELEPYYIYLPYVSDGGLITLHGSTFAITPTLADKAISIGTNHMYIPLGRVKLNFSRQVQKFQRDGRQETAYIVWSQIYRLNSKQKRMLGRRAVTGNTTLPLYLFAHYGLTEAFRQFNGAQVKVGFEDTINTETCPPDQWTICSSACQYLRPSGYKDSHYVGSPIRLAIRHEDYSLTTASMIAGFFNIVDLFPRRVMPEYVDDPYLWIVLLGHLIFGGNVSEGKLAEDVITHLESMKGYVHPDIRANLAEEGVYCEDIFGLFVYMVENFNHLITQSTTQVASMYDKRLMVLRYVMENYVNAANTLMFKFHSTKKRPLNRKDVEATMRTILRTDLMSSLTSEHKEISSASSPGSNKLYKITTQLMLQVDSSKSDPSKLLHASIAEVGNYMTPSKNDSTGRRRLNPYVKTDRDGLIIRDPDKVELLERVQREIQR